MENRSSELVIIRSWPCLESLHSDHVKLTEKYERSTNFLSFSEWSSTKEILYVEGDFRDLRVLCKSNTKVCPWILTLFLAFWRNLPRNEISATSPQIFEAAIVWIVEVFRNCNRKFASRENSLSIIHALYCGTVVGFHIQTRYLRMGKYNR